MSYYEEKLNIEMAKLKCFEDGFMDKVCDIAEHLPECSIDKMSDLIKELNILLSAWESIKDDVDVAQSYYEKELEKENVSD